MELLGKSKKLVSLFEFLTKIFLFFRFVFNYLCKFSWLRGLLNRRLIRSMEVGYNFDDDEHKQLQERSAKTLNDYKLEFEKKGTKKYFFNFQSFYNSFVMFFKCNKCNRKN